MVTCDKITVTKFIIKIAPLESSLSAKIDFVNPRHARRFESNVMEVKVVLGC